MKETFDKQLEKFISLLQVLMGDGVTLSTKTGSKFAKVIYATPQRSVYCFIDIATGDIYKPASWAAPAKHARGNIYNENPLIGCTQYGIVYLR